MGRKKKELPLLKDIEITAVAAEGNSIARYEDRVIFIPYGAPGDVADVQIDKKKHSFWQGHIQNLKKSSPYRIDPKCLHFGVCGGCKWQHVPYHYQLQFKRQQVIDVLQRIAKVPFPDVKECLGSEKEWEYRNKVEYTFSNKRWLTYDQIKNEEEISDRRGVGFHIPGAFDKVLDIAHCYLHDDLGNQLRNFLRDYATEKNLSFYDLKGQYGFLRTLMIRTFTTGQSLVVISFGENNEELIARCLKSIVGRFPQITSLNYVINTKVNDSIADLEVINYYGRGFAEEKLGQLIFRISPQSFYQTNSLQAQELYSVVRKMADLQGDELVYDLYTGTGTIANFLAPHAKHVIGIEYVEEAIKDAWLNAEINGISNTEFFAGDMKDILKDEFIARHGHPEVMIIDPPRAGMHQDVVNVILNAAPKTIIYVSCNPATQARDVALLSSKYTIEEVQPVDMFPHTQHVENVIKLRIIK